jgi:hypothetical protein
MVLRLQRVTPIVSSQLSRPDTRGVTMRNTARQTRENRTITVNFQSEAAYFQLLGDRKTFLECVLAFVMSLGLETITKWGLRSFPVLVQTCLHPGVPATKCRAQIIV